MIVTQFTCPSLAHIIECSQCGLASSKRAFVNDAAVPVLSDDSGYPEAPILMVMWEPVRSMMRCLNMVVNGEVTRNVTAAGVRLGIVMVSGDYEEIEWVTVRNCWVTSVSGVALYKIRPTLCLRHGLKCFGQSNFFLR